MTAPFRFGHRGSTRDVMRMLQRGGVPHPMRQRLLYQQIVTVSDFTGAGATTQTLTLNTLFPKNVFPTEADLLAGATVENVVLPVGTSITALTIQLGGVFDAGTDADGLLTASNLLGSGAAVGDVLNTVGAANYANRYESAFSPTVLLTSTGANLSALTAISFKVIIPWTPRLARS